MNKNYQKRKRIFDRFSKHLNFLKERNKLKHINLKFVETYICPICLNHFSPKDLSDDAPNMLTLEDAPPKSLKGTANVLTCKKCNSECGHKIDFHLTERMLELDAYSFLPNSKIKGKFTKDDKTVFGELTVEKNKTGTAFYHKKINNPKLLDKYIDKLDPNGEDPVFSFEPKKSRVDLHRLQVAILKTAYLLAFEKFGYSFILDKSYDQIREQLKNPDKKIYPEGFWIKQSFIEDHVGVNFILDKDLEAVFPIFSLETDSSIRRFGVALPLPGKEIEKTIKILNQQKPEFVLTLDPMGGNDVDYLYDIEAINKMNNWIKKLENAT